VEKLTTLCNDTDAATVIAAKGMMVGAAHPIENREHMVQGVGDHACAPVAA
jgi:hypothetical protein